MATSIYSEPDNGTIFRIYLPIIDSTVEEMKPIDLPFLKEKKKQYSLQRITLR
jgi:hypothetical protein